MPIRWNLSIGDETNLNQYSCKLVANFIQSGASWRASTWPLRVPGRPTSRRSFHPKSSLLEFMAAGMVPWSSWFAHRDERKSPRHGGDGHNVNTRLCFRIIHLPSPAVGSLPPPRGENSCGPIFVCTVWSCLKNWYNNFELFISGLQKLYTMLQGGTNKTFLPSCA